MDLSISKVKFQKKMKIISKQDKEAGGVADRAPA
jgi:hypothetical protein